MRLMIIFVRYLMSLTGAIKQESCRHHCQQDSLSKTEPKSLPCNFYLCNIYCNLNKSNYL